MFEGDWDLCQACLDQVRYDRIVAAGGVPIGRGRAPRSRELAGS
jgi:hypothetical protein